MRGLSEVDIESLAVAVLGVGGWPTERVRAAVPALSQVGVLSPEGVATMDLGVLTMALAKNGYSRGLLTSMYAERLQAVMREVASGGLGGLPALVEAGDRDGFIDRLMQIHGVGPKVAGRAWDLMTCRGDTQGPAAG